jgi:5-hydroxyisourate hydrolase-like protein (transthyretin family)
VPAELAVRLSFEAGDDARWLPRNPKPLMLSQGETKDLGALTFEPALPVQVQVVDLKGKPVAGVSVRRLQSRGEEKVWLIGKETNANGLAGFFVRKHSKASFQVSPDILAPGNSSKYFAVRADFQAKDFPPRKPATIRLNDEQIQTLFARSGVN